MLMVKDKANYLRQQRMDLRDERIRLQRKLSALQDIEFWEPENFTDEQKQQIEVLQYKIAELRELEEEMNNND